MSGRERREQLIEVGRGLFSRKGFQATSIEEIAERAKITKPLIYEHFGGKEGLYAVVVDREVKALLDRITDGLDAEQPRLLLEQAALAFLGYIQDNPEGFRVLVRDSPVTGTAGTLASVIDEPELSLRELLDLVNLAWNGLSQLDVMRGLATMSEPNSITKF